MNDSLMNNYERRPIAIAYLLIFTLLFSTFAFGQNAGKTEQAKAIPAQIETPAFAAYLMEVQGNNEGSQSYTKEAQSLAKILSSNTAKNAVLIDEFGKERCLGPDLRTAVADRRDVVILRAQLRELFANLVGCFRALDEKICTHNIA